MKALTMILAAAAVSAATALAGIDAMEAFYRSIGMPVTITELLGRPITDEEAAEMARRCSHDGAITVGRLRVLDRNDIFEIYKLAR